VTHKPAEQSVRLINSQKEKRAFKTGKAIVKKGESICQRVGLALEVLHVALTSRL